ncbi:MAG: restriction endonuclease subunit S [Phormidesmis sp. CAN_BIN44]|nr:restriction endonuclease subunit S [Phormidesmis sp. CAN_BIN44]
MRSDCYVSVGIPVIRGNNISTSRSFKRDFVYITEDKADALRSSNVFADDLFFPHRGAIGEVGIISKDDRQRYVLSSSLMKLTCNKKIVEPLYLLYFFRSPQERHELLKNASTVGTPGIATPLASLKSISVLLPPLDEQKAIAHILGTLDDKIELNPQLNHTLESVARALFKSWFIDFDPVRAKLDGRQPAGMDAETAALFPAEFEDSAIDEIPTGWRSGVLKDISENPKRTIRPEQIPVGTPYVGLEHMPKRSIALSDWGVSDNVESNKFQFENGDILFGKLRPYFHKVGVAIQNGVCSTDILVIIPKCSEWFSLALAYVSSDEFVEYTNMSSDGTRMPRTNWQVMGQYPITIPSFEVAKAFNTEVSVIVQTIRSNIFQLKTLASIRDALLPKLLSGEIHVKDAEKVIEEVA